jgi:hypothetical protein
LASVWAVWPSHLSVTVIMSLLIPGGHGYVVGHVVLHHTFVAWHVLVATSLGPFHSVPGPSVSAAGCMVFLKGHIGNPKFVCF